MVENSVPIPLWKWDWIIRRWIHRPGSSLLPALPGISPSLTTILRSFYRIFTLKQLINVIYLTPSTFLTTAPTYCGSEIHVALSLTPAPFFLLMPKASPLSLLPSSLNPQMCFYILFDSRPSFMCFISSETPSEPSWFLSTLPSPKRHLFREVLLDEYNPVIQLCSLLGDTLAMATIFICLWFCWVAYLSLSKKGKGRGLISCNLV